MRSSLLLVLVAKVAGKYLERQFRIRSDATLRATVRPIAMPATTK